MTVTSNGVDHGITINEVHLPAGTPLRASCLCGWQSAIVPSRPRAVDEGTAHLAVSAWRYRDRVAESIAQRVRERDTAPTFDEIATIASALDCSAADLLPLHLQGATR